MGRNIRFITEPDECREAWQKLMPSELISDLWEVREAFQKAFDWPLLFIVSESGGQIDGLLPLSFVRELNAYSYFPGEIWHNLTWLEQNRVITSEGANPLDFFSNIPGEYHVRYLLENEGLESDHELDEIGYLFHPAEFDYSLDRYFEKFSGKHKKKLFRELEEIEKPGIELRLNNADDLNILFEMNISRFGKDSYFSDPRFLAGFKNLIDLYRARGWLRVTTVLIGGVVAAVDLGCLRNGQYILFAGGTSAEFPGVAKWINLHHMKVACAEKMREVDFLCGDFFWKKHFHLTPRPLYLLKSGNAPAKPA